MSGPFTLETFGVELVAASVRRELILFRLEQRKKMREAGNLIKRDVIAKVEEIFPAGTSSHKRRGAKPLGPLRRKIAVRIQNTTADVSAFIRPRASAFYGRFQETGLSVQRKTKHGSHHFYLKRKPYLEPIAKADASKVVAIMGEAYDVFYRGGA